MNYVREKRQVNCTDTLHIRQGKKYGTQLPVNSNKIKANKIKKYLNINT